MSRIAARVSLVERAIHGERTGYCPHLPPIIDKYDADGALIPWHPNSPRRYLPVIPDEQDCPCCRARLRIVVRYRNVGIHGQLVDE